MDPADHQNLTVRLSTQVIRKARVLAAQQGTSISQIVAELIEQMVTRGEAYEAAKRRGLAMLKTGFRLGGKRMSRDDLHDR